MKEKENNQVSHKSQKTIKIKRLRQASVLLTRSILLGSVSAGVFLTDWIPNASPFGDLRLENLRIYIMQVFNTAGTRAIMIGIALGIASTSLKIMLGIDRSFLGSGD